jgi:hypothetical protein
MSWLFLKDRCIFIPKSRNIMFDDDEDSEFERSEFDIWYDDNNWCFRRGAVSFVEPDLEVELFYSNVYCKIMTELAPAVRKLIVYQYPVFETEFRPAVLEAIESVVERTGHRLMLELYNLIQDQKEGINLREKYPNFEKWEERKKESEYFSRTIFDTIEGLTEKQKSDLYELVKVTFKNSFNWKDQRRYEFMEMVQSIVFRHYKAVQELDADGWIVYFYFLMIEHTDYRLDFEHYVTFIEYEFDEADLEMPYDEYRKKLQQKINDKWNQKPE